MPAFAPEESRNSRNLEPPKLTGNRKRNPGREPGDPSSRGNGKQTLRASGKTGTGGKGESGETREEWREEGKNVYKEEEKEEFWRNSALFLQQEVSPELGAQGEGGRKVGNLRLGAREGPINEDPINQ